MATDTRRAQRLVAFALIAIALVGLGALGATAVIRHRAGDSAAAPVSVSGTSPTPPTPAQPTAAGDPTQDVELLLTPEAVTRLKLESVPVINATLERTISVPGTVFPNAYKEVKVSSIAGGIVTQLHAELGTPVHRGAPLATVFSAELAEAQTKLLSTAAMLDADRRRLERTQELVKIGAASRQELDEVTAVRAARETEVAAARQRLLLLGLNPAQIDALTSPGQIVSTVIVPAPIAGVITTRSVNTGQVVSPGQEVFVVTDLSTVWVVGELYERDLVSVGVGASARITTAAYPGFFLSGRVSYVDPRVDPQSRTVKVRLEVPDPAARLKLGMYVAVELRTPEETPRLLVPHAAVQTLGERQVVFLAFEEEPGRYVQRTVQLGPLAADRYPVLAGLKAGDRVVTQGSFFLRAESLRNSSGG
ncbi:MAG TPA: efflux RND transporter periplasmic adaptor subunit [Methylomirabilota bacterium]|nr:efflux RND transporter periplasmic adaptor subunit [Methylomirabilota bacterium]